MGRPSNHLAIAGHEEDGSRDPAFGDPQRHERIGRRQAGVVHALRRRLDTRDTSQQEEREYGDPTPARAGYRVLVQMTMTPQFPPVPAPDCVMPYSIGISAGRR